jgi:hypothetical protein
MQRVIAEEFLSAALIEGDLHHPAIAGRVMEGKVGQPVVHVQAVTATTGTAAVTLAATGFTLIG